MTVTYPHNCALGGDLIAIVREPEGRTRVVNASGSAPRALDVQALRSASTTMPVIGVHTVTVPGLVGGWKALHERGAALPWDAALASAIDLAREGTPVTPRLATAITACAGVDSDPGMAMVFAPDGRPLRAGESLRQPALGDTLARLAADGPASFYEGEIAVALVEGLHALGSALTREDFARFVVRDEVPLRVDLGELQLLTAAPNSAGVLLAQALLALRSADLADALVGDAGTLATIFSAGNEQRDRELGDPDFHEFCETAWLGEERLAEIADAGPPPGERHRSARPTGDTVAIVVTDIEGRAVSLIQSVFHSFGAQILEPSTGIIMHNRGASFSLAPDHPNTLEPGKRPAHTLMPVMVERAGDLLGVLGTMGGRVQAQIHVQVLQRLLHGASAQEAVSAPRFAVGPMEMGEPGDIVRVEEDCDGQVAAAIRAAGFSPLTVPRHSEDLGHAQAIWLADGVQAGSDPRADGVAVGVARTTQATTSDPPTKESRRV